MVVISNTSPIIVFYHAQLLHLFEKLFGSIYIPSAVHAELSINAQDKNLVSSVANCDFIKMKPLEIPIPNLQHQLDLGEIEALTLAQQLKADLLILDDKRAQKEAKLLSIPYVSSFSVLVKAYQKGFISNIQEILKRLEDNYIFLNKDMKVFLFYLKKS